MFSGGLKTQALRVRRMIPGSELLSKLRVFSMSNVVIKTA
jgi:hypothetical protein